MQSRISLSSQFSYCIILIRFLLPHPGTGLTRKPQLFTRQLKSHYPVSAANPFLLKSHDMNQWDAENGVWLGDMATSDDVLPSPLYMFGYGSLLWRPGDLLCDFPSYSCVCSGWQRIFAQRSSDHRGSPEFPGFVATLVEASYLDSVNREVPSRKTLGGLIWTIPDDRVEATIAELDYRERGGYHRHVINVTLNEGTAYHPAGTVVNALVYSGSISNPNFHFILDGTELRDNRPATEGLTESFVEMETGTETETFSPRSATADIIAAAVGPSGPNCEYLFNLNDYILLNRLEDGYIETLARNVALRLGPWRSPVLRRYRGERFKKPLDSTVLSDQAVEKVSSTAIKSVVSTSGELIQSESESKSDGGLLEAFLRTNMILGWGSNEHQQLGARTVMTHPVRALQATCSPISLEGERGSVGVRKANQKTEHTQGDSGSCAHNSAVDLRPQNGVSRRNLLASQIQYSQILCGVGYSAFLGPTGTFSFWGESAADYVFERAAPVSDTERSAETDRKPADALKGSVVASAVIRRPSPTADSATTGPESAGLVKEVLTVSDVAGAALGYEHMLLLSGSGWVTALGDNYWGQCRGPSSFVRVGSEGLKSRLPNDVSSSGECCYTANITPSDDSDSECMDSGPTVRILKVATGVRHSAAVTVDGSLYVWGTGSAARIVPMARQDCLSLSAGAESESQLESESESEAKGSQRDVMVSQEVIAGRKIGAMLVMKSEGMTELRGSPSASDAEMQKPTSVVPSTAQGLRDMTTNSESRSAVGTSVDVTVDLCDSGSTKCDTSWCPPDAKLIDVSCGLHHTVAVDERGRVWSFGNDKFGSLGRPLPPPISTPITVPVAALRGSDGTSLGTANGYYNAPASDPSKGRGGKGVVRVETKDSTPRLVEGLEQGVRWQRACCGWSHTVIRGVRPDGSIACAAWGRRNLGQYPLENSRVGSRGGVTRNNGTAAAAVAAGRGRGGAAGGGGGGKSRLGEDGQQESCDVGGAEGSENSKPQRLSLPNSLSIREVWAGTEFTVVADEKGYLWACGWNEHGNLGKGGSCAFESSHEWVRVLTSRHGDEGTTEVEVEAEAEVGAADDLRSERTDPGSAVTHGQQVQVRLSTVWEGSLACGGGHVLCLTDAIIGRDL